MNTGNQKQNHNDSRKGWSEVIPFNTNKQVIITIQEGCRGWTKILQTVRVWIALGYTISITPAGAN